MRTTHAPWPPFYTKVKPPAGARINWGDPSAEGLLFYAPFIDCVGLTGDDVPQAVDMVSTTFGVPSTAKTVFVGQPGPTGRSVFVGNSAGAFLKWNVATVPVGCGMLATWMAADNPFTIGVKFCTNNGNANTGNIIGIAGGTVKWQLLMNNGVAGRLDWRILGATDPIVSGRTTYNDGNWYTAFCTHNNGATANGESMTIFDKDGVLLEEVTGTTGNFSTGTAADLTIGANAAASLLFSGQVEFAAVWNNFLEDAEMQSIAARPYQMLTVPTPINRWMLASLAAGAVPTGFYPLYADQHRPRPEVVTY